MVPFYLLTLVYTVIIRLTNRIGVVTIATTVWIEETFVLQDGTEVSVRPLSIKKLREFMKIISHLGEGDTAEERETNTVDTIVKAALLAIDASNSEVKKTKVQYEEILDIPTLYKIIELAGGVKLDEPNLTVE